VKLRAGDVTRPSRAGSNSATMGKHGLRGSGFQVGIGLLRERLDLSRVDRLDIKRGQSLGFNSPFSTIFASNGSTHSSSRKGQANAGRNEEFIG
jgi:hypothetical protein